MARTSHSRIVATLEIRETIGKMSQTRIIVTNDGLRLRLSGSDRSAIPSKT